MNRIVKTELLSPAGSMDALKQAVHNGADAIYLGGTQFGARAYANNFDKAELKEAVKHAHLYGVRIYVTVNTLVFETEITAFKEYIDFLVSIGVDALIMQDIGMAIWAINSYDIPIHSSTQMHNYSVSNIEYLKETGFNRAVAARETEINTITKMSKIMDTEIFAHGALCISYSGQCLFSAIEHQRSGNRGRCAQACRMRYSLYADDKLIKENKYLLSPKDLALLEDTEEIIKAGACSVKLEGRMKSPEYVGFVTKTYREIIDNYYAGKPFKITNKQNDSFKRLFNRGFTKGYAFGHDNSSLMTIDRPNHAGVHIGDVISTDKEFITVKLMQTLHQGDGVKFHKTDKGFVCNKIYYNGKLVSKGGAGQTIQLDNKLNLNSNDKLLLTKDINLLKSLDNYYEKKIPIKIQAEFSKDKPCKITLEDSLGNAVSHQGAVVQPSKNAPLSKENITDNLTKLGDSPYFARNINISMDKNIFLSKSNINKLRREAVAKLNDIRTQTIKYSKNEYNINYSAPPPSPVAICCTVSSEAQLNKVLDYNVDRIYVRGHDLYKKYKSMHENIYCFMDGLSENITEYKNENIVIRDTGTIRYAKNNNVMADYMLNIANRHSLAHLHTQGIKGVCLSVELDDNSISALTSSYTKSYGNLPNAEMLIYGCIQMMVLKHCILENNIQCGKCKNTKTELKDIKGNSFPLLTDDNCRNYIYSKEPVNRIDNIEYLKSIGVNGFRLDFINETEDEIDYILSKIL